MRPMLKRTLALAVLLSALPLAFVQAQSIVVAHAVELYRDGALPESMGAFEAALRSGRLDRADLARVCWHLGVLRMITGRSDDAGEMFEFALALDDTLGAPTELPPEQQQVFENARGVQPLTFSWLAPPQGLTLAIRADGPEALRQGVRVRTQAVGAVTHPFTQHPIQPVGPLVLSMDEWHDESQLHVVAELLDAHGNVTAVEERTIEHPIEQVQALAIEPERSVARSPWLWTSVAIVVIGAVLTAVLLATARDEYRAGPPILE